MCAGLVRQRVLAPGFVNWMLEVYFDIMADLEAIGVPPFNCEVNSLPSGTHAVFMAAMACETVNVFGMSYTGEGVYTRSAHVQYEVSERAIHMNNKIHNLVSERAIHMNNKIHKLVSERAVHMNNKIHKFQI
eukprot:190879-Pyramimonas_sp.AAC.1